MTSSSWCYKLRLYGEKVKYYEIKDMWTTQIDRQSDREADSSIPRVFLRFYDDTSLMS